MTSSSKYRARRSSCSSLNAPPPSAIRCSSRSVPRPAGHVEDLPAHERGLLRGEVQDRGRHVLGPAAAARRDLLYHLLHELLEVQAEAGGCLAGHLRLDKPWGHGVSRYAVAPELDRERLRETDHARFGGRVVGLPAVAQSARGR